MEACVTYLDLCAQILLDVSLHVISDLQFLDDNVLVLAGAEARWNQLLRLHCVVMPALGLFPIHKISVTYFKRLLTYVLIHLIAKFLELACLLLLAIHVLVSHVIIVPSDTVVQIFHHFLIESLCCGNMLLVALESRLPCLALDRVSVLDHTRIALRVLIAAIVQGLDQ